MAQGAIVHPMPPLEHLTGLRPQGFSNRLGWSTTLNHGLDIPQQMCPAELATPGRIPVIRTQPIGDQPPPKVLPQEFLGGLPTARQPHHKNRDPGRDRGPQPRALLSLAPPGFVQVGRRLLLDVASGFRHGLSHRLRGRPFQVRQCIQTDRHAKQIVTVHVGHVRNACSPKPISCTILLPWIPSPHCHKRSGSVRPSRRRSTSACSKRASPCWRPSWDGFTEELCRAGS